MPCLDIKINVDKDVFDKQGPEFIKQITEELAKVLNKPSQYMMIVLNQSMVAMGADLKTPTAWCTLSYLGPLVDDPSDENLILELNQAISKCIAQNLEKYFKASKYFLIIHEEERINWGKDGGIPFYKKPKKDDEQKEDKK